MTEREAPPRAMDERALSILQRKYAESAVALLAYVAEHCGTHEPTQHRDGRAPWCAKCHRDKWGRHKDSMQSKVRR